jgi:hypothetical protein
MFISTGRPIKTFWLDGYLGFGSQAGEAASYIQGDVVSSLNPEIDVDIGIQPFRLKNLSAQDRGIRPQQNPI